MTIPVTTFRGLRFTKPSSETTLEEVLSYIRSDKWKDKISKCREDLKYKDWLPVFTPTGIFHHRSIQGLSKYNGVICLDVDQVEDPVALKEKAKSLPWVHAAFITPSGHGLKVIVLTNATTYTYRFIEEKVAEAWLEATGSPRDNHCKDIARIQYISHDPDLYYNPGSTIFEEKLHIIDFMEEISSQELLKAVENQLHWQKTSENKFEYTVVDEIYKLYMEPLCGPGASARFESYDFVCREIAKRVFEKKMK